MRREGRSLCLDGDGEAAAGGCAEFKSRFGSDVHLFDGVCLGVLVPRGVFGVGIDGGDVFLARRQELKVEVGIVSVLVCRATDESVF